ncbi:hypothetical protein [Conexibacter sp. SYSU D00693]|uniref:hypothetical protein n=1 Tax=Conexibacter sp. SYSU D00693 TaxID=2812560 RepID=UPI00196AFC8F|nr:hypothetical protein [Conexibacter sp. SYSU D00693]
MPRVLACLLVVVASVVAGCGAGGTDALRAWEVEPPYLPPRDPSSIVAEDAARRDAAQAERQADAARVGAGDRQDRAQDDAVAEDRVAEGAPTDAEVQAALRQAYGGEGATDVDRASVDASGRAIVPPTAPRRLVALMRGANEVARKPYVYGGGHGRNPDEIWQDSAYDCSGSISYALATAGYIEGPMTSGSLADWGKPGPGKWVTIYANAEHAFMVVAGLRFDTSGRADAGTRWQASTRSVAGFTVRHPPGL